VGQHRVQQRAKMRPVLAGFAGRLHEGFVDKPGSVQTCLEARQMQRGNCAVGHDEHALGWPHRQDRSPGRLEQASADFDVVAALVEGNAHCVGGTAHGDPASTPGCAQ